MAHPHHGVDIAAGVEIGFQLHPDRIRCHHQVIQDAVGHLFMGDRLVAVTVHIEFDCLELHHPGPGLVDQTEHRKIGVTGERALAGEFRQLNRHLIGPAWPRVVEADQLSAGNGALAVERGLGLLIRHEAE